MTHFLKIGVVIPKYGLIGGGEKFVYEITERLAQSPNLDVHVFANRWRGDGSRTTFHHIPIIVFPRFLSLLSFAWLAQKRMENVGIDIIHTHERIFDADIYTMHGIPHRRWVETVRKKRMSLFDYTTAYIEQHLAERSRCRYFLAVSEMTKHAFSSSFNHPANAVEVLYPGVDTTPFESLNRSRCRNWVRAKYGLAPFDKVVLFVGMNFEIKGLDHLIAGVAMAKRKPLGSAIKLLVVGKGNLSKYKQLARQWGIESDVVFAGVVQAEIEKVYMGCDVFCMLSRFDTFGLTVLEAMAASLPVLISRGVGARDIVNQGQNGYVVDRTNAEAIGGYLLLLTENERSKEMGRQAQATAKRFSWDLTVERLKSIYRDVHRAKTPA